MLLLLVLPWSNINGRPSRIDFSYDGICYNITSDNTVEVCYIETWHLPPDDDDVKIPSIVSYEGIRYTVIGIGSGAFSDAEMLSKSVTIPNSVTYIDDSAFNQCYYMKSVTIPNSVERIGDSAFAYCWALTSVVIPNSVKRIGSYAFENCKGLTSVEIPNSVKKIGSGAFKNCSSLTSVTIGDSVKSIGGSTFRGCAALASVTIGNSVKEIGEGAFYSCSALSQLKIGNSVTSIGVEAFYSCSSLTQLTIPKSVTYIDNSAFGSCTGMISVCFEDSKDWLVGDASFSCTDLYVGRNLKMDRGGSGFSGLRKIVIGSGVTEFYNCVFYGLVDEVYSAAVNPPVFSGLDSARDAFSDLSYKNGTLYVPIGSKKSYQKAAYWEKFLDIREFDFGGVDGAATDGGIRVSAGNGNIEVKGAGDGAVIEVYNIGGQLVYRGSDTVISVPARGVYVVRVAGEAFKVAL